jgi:hypothetical protein
MNRLYLTNLNMKRDYLERIDLLKKKRNLLNLLKTDLLVNNNIIKRKVTKKSKKKVIAKSVSNQLNSKSPDRASEILPPQDSKYIICKDETSKAIIKEWDPRFDSTARISVENIIIKIIRFCKITDSSTLPTEDQILLC